MIFMREHVKKDDFKTGKIFQFVTLELDLLIWLKLFHVPIGSCGYRNCHRQPALMTSIREQSCSVPRSEAHSRISVITHR